MKAYFFRLLLACALCLTSVSCVKQHIEDDSNQREQALMVAREFLTAFFMGDKPTVLKTSDVPFYVEDDLFTDTETYEKELVKELSNKRPESFKIAKMTFHSSEDLEAFDRQLYSHLAKKGFKMDGDLYLVAAYVEVNGGPEQGFLLIKKQLNGWKVVGILG